MNTIKITTEFSPEDRKLLEGLMGSVSLLASVLGDMLPIEVQQKILKEATGSDHPVDTPTTHLEPVEETAPVEPVADEPVPDEPTPEVTPVSFAEFQKAATQAVAKGPKQKAAAKEIINKYAASVSAVPEDKRAEVMEELAKI
jgi:hypothetical protein